MFPDQNVSFFNFLNYNQTIKFIVRILFRNVKLFFFCISGISRQPPCNQTANTAPECKLPAKCLTHQGMQCKDVEKQCSDGEEPPCYYKKCEPMEICLTPEVT